jgi:Family of unknown function (DUF6491)
MRVSIALFAGLALAACASTEHTATAPPEGRDCFNASSVNGYSYIDDRHVSVSVGANRKYTLTTMFNARDLDWTQAIAIRSSTGWICTGNGLGVEIIGGEPRRTYPITSIERAPDTAPAVEGS